jgi:hypothetical protein
MKRTKKPIEVVSSTDNTFFIPKNIIWLQQPMFNTFYNSQFGLFLVFKRPGKDAYILVAVMTFSQAHYLSTYIVYQPQCKRHHCEFIANLTEEN